VFSNKNKLIIPFTDKNYVKRIHSGIQLWLTFDEGKKEGGAY
jgi:hypothetical protein